MWNTEYTGKVFWCHSKVLKVEKENTLSHLYKGKEAFEYLALSEAQFCYCLLFSFQ